LVKIQQLRLQQLSLRLHQGISELLTEQHHRLALQLSQLQTLSPLAVLSRGYAIVKHEQTGEVVHGLAEMKSGDRLQIQFAAGEVTAIVTEIGLKGSK